MRTLAHLPRSAVDVVVALVGLALVELATWVRPNPIGTPVAGPTWLLAVYPVLLAAPLAWRRSAPLAAFTVIMCGVVLQGTVTGNSAEGGQWLYALGIGAFSVAAHSPRRRAIVGLAIGLVGYAVYAAENRDIRTGKASELWAGSFFGVALVAVWLVGVFVRNHREEQVTRARAAAIEREAQFAVSDERARLARELHDVISHNLSVVVVQAAGARASGGAQPATLENIERSGRESLVEMRRLLGVLRHDGADPPLAPQPAVADIEELAEHVRAAGVPVDVIISGDYRDLAPAIDLSAYRIVQESLTNVLKHAGRARVTVTVSCDAQVVTIDVVDDGAGATTHTETGHGLIGMRERVAAFGGELRTGPRPGGGFEVHARLVREVRPS
ncbi:MAG: sensor histidine kinase [Nocardioidaceae bacterium]